MQKTRITLADGIEIEVQASEDERELIADADIDERLGAAIDAVRPVLIKTCKPVIEVWKELNKEMSMDEATVQLGLGFSAKGNVFIASGTADANLTVTLKLRPKD